MGDVSNRINELNALALAENLHDLRETTDIRFIALEREVVTLRNLVAAQTQVIGDAIQRLQGSGSTVPE